MLLLEMGKKAISAPALLDFLRWYDPIERSLCNPLVSPLWRAALIEGFLSKEQSRAGLLEHEVVCQSVSSLMCVKMETTLV
jgi:hypothetical protein